MFRTKRGGKTGGRVRTGQALGFMELWSSSNTVRIQFATSERDPTAGWRGSGLRRELWRVFVQEHQDLAS